MKRIVLFALALFCAPGAFAQEDSGVASYYGDEFNGRKTASGAIYDPQAMTAAHRTLRFGTRLLVTNLDNGKQAVVTVNDRGPFVKNRLIDLSKAAAFRLGVVGPGTANVKIRALEFTEVASELERTERSKDPREVSKNVVGNALVTGNDRSPPPGFVAGANFVQVGAFRTEEGSKVFAHVLLREGFSPQIRGDGGVYRVYLRGHNDANTIDLLKKLTDSGQKTFLQVKSEPRGFEVKLTTN